MNYQTQPQYFNPQQLGGMVYQPVPQAKMTTGLTAEQVKEMRRQSGGFSLDIPTIEFTKARCCHKDPTTGQITLVDNSDGTHTCSICGKTFQLAQYGVPEAQEVTDAFLSLFQSIKTYYLNMPEAYIDNITQIMPVIEQFPTLYQVALADFNKYENGNGLAQRGGMYGSNLLNAIVNPGYQMQYGAQPAMYQQQQMMYPQQQMQYAAQPGMYPQQQQPGYYDPSLQVAQQQVQYQQPMSNGFGYVGMPNQPQQQPVVNPMATQQQAPQQTVQGGTGSSYTKENAAKNVDVETTKVFNR